MRHHRQHHRGLPHPPWMEDLLAWLVIGLVVLLNLILMWRIATATV